MFCFLSTSAALSTDIDCSTKMGNGKIIQNLYNWVTNDKNLLLLLLLLPSVYRLTFFSFCCHQLCCCCLSLSVYFGHILCSTLCALFVFTVNRNPNTTKSAALSLSLSCFLYLYFALFISLISTFVLQFIFINSATWNKCVVCVCVSALARSDQN